MVEGMSEVELYDSFTETILSPTLDNSESRLSNAFRFCLFSFVSENANTLFHVSVPPYFFGMSINALRPDSPFAFRISLLFSCRFLVSLNLVFNGVKFTSTTLPSWSVNSEEEPKLIIADNGRKQLSH